MLELAKHFVVDASIVAQLNRGFAFSVQKFLRKSAVLIIKILNGIAGFAVMIADAGESLGVMLFEVLVEVIGIREVAGTIALLKFRERGLGHEASGFLFLAIRAGCGGETEGADQRRKSKALHYEGHENDREG